MAEKVELVDPKNLMDKLVEFGRENIYMGLGLIDVVQENTLDWWKKGVDYRHTLIERGGKLFDQNREKVDDLVEMPQAVAKDTLKKANETFDKYSEQVLSRMHVPTADMIDSMTKKVNAVDRKLDKVIKEAAAEKA